MSRSVRPRRPSVGLAARAGRHEPARALRRPGGKDADCYPGGMLRFGPRRVINSYEPAGRRRPADIRRIEEMARTAVVRSASLSPDEARLADDLARSIAGG